MVTGADKAIGFEVADQLAAYGLMVLGPTAKGLTMTKESTAGVSWVAGFRSAMVSPYEKISLTPSRGFADQTIRQILHLDGGGLQFRIRLSNRYGTAPLAIGVARVALRETGSRIAVATDTVLRFDGRAAFELAAGAEAISDPVEFPVRAGDDLAISLYCPDRTGLATFAQVASETGYAAAGDAVSAPEFSGAEEFDSRFYLTGVDVLAPAGTRVAVAFGASWTEGTASTHGANRRFPNLLNNRLHRNWVVNQGIAGNRLLTDEVGESGLGRFDRDVLAVPGVHHVLFQFGLNDLGFTDFGQPPASATALIQGFIELAERAHAAGLTVTATTLGPMGGAIYAGYDTPAGRATAKEVDDWMRGSDLFDALTDFSRVLESPEAPGHLRPDLDSGDHLHPNDAGYQAMADAVDLSPLQ